MTDQVERIRSDAAHLIKIEPMLAPGWSPSLVIPHRGGGFGTLIHLILGQQVSLEAARAMFSTLEEETGGLTPEGLMALDDNTLRRCGFSRPKADYARGLATEIIARQLDLTELDSLPDNEIVARLTAFKGIGQWTAECYLLFGLARPDVFPTGDLALQVGWQEMAGLPQRPSPIELAAIAREWTPRRTAAAHLIWSDYLKRRNRSP